MSSSSLYGYTGNVTVSANNLTTLYNAQPGNVVVANVPDRNFTTLYTNQSSILPTKAYGNANVEAFLNAGTDGANSVQNIHMSGNLYVGDQSYLGNAGNVHITGGQLNYVLATDGGGGLFWTQQSGLDTNIVPYIHFDVSVTANNQQFTDTLIENYASNNEMNVMKNGVNIEPAFFEKISNNTIQINIPLNSGDTIDILATGAGGNGEPAGNVYEVQYNGSGVFAANSSFTFDQANSLLTVGNISTGNITFDNVLGNSGNIANLDIVNSNIDNLNVTTSAILGDVSNVSIGGGANGQYLITDGSGNLSWFTGTGGTPTSLNANISNVIINGGSNGEVLTTYGNGTLYWSTASGGGTPGGSNTQIQFNNSGNFAGSANFTFDSANSVLALNGDLALTKAGGNIYANNFAYFRGEGIGFYPTNGWFVDTVSVGSSFIDFSGNARFNQAISPSSTSTVNLGGVSYVKITGGSSGQFLSTDGVGNLSWASATAANANYANFAGNVVNSAQPNITSLGTLTSLSVSGNINTTGTTTIQQAKEKVTANATGSTGTITYDVLTQAILLKTANASANFTLNIRGNSTTTFNTFAANNESTTITFVNRNGTTGYIMSALQIDGVSQTLLWANGTPPSVGTTSGYDVYNFNIIKTAANTYAVFSTVGGYK